MKQILRACGKCPVEPALVPRGTSILWWPTGAEVDKRGKQEVRFAWDRAFQTCDLKQEENQEWEAGREGVPPSS